MKILILVDTYPPEISSAASLMQDLAQGLKKRGHEVLVVTTNPRHYLSKSGLGALDEGSVLRVHTLPIHKVNFVIRGISQLLLPFLFYRAVTKNIKTGLDGVIVYSPPITLGLAGKWIKKKYSAKFILNLQDIFPQNAIDLGIIRNGVVASFFEMFERMAYNSADIITFNSPGGVEFLVRKKMVPQNKVKLLYNWINVDSFQVSSRIPDGKLKILFAGIMGPAQGLDFVLDVAHKLKIYKDIEFILAGDGMERPRLEKRIKTEDLGNVTLLGLVPKNEYPKLLQTADVGLVCLSAKNKTPFIPGKFLGYMAAGKPILAFLNKESDGFGLIQESNSGYATQTGDIGAAEDAVLKMRENKNNLHEMGQKGRSFMEKNMSLEPALDKMEKFLG